MKHYLYILKPFLNLVVFLLALSFESASPERTTLLVTCFTVFLAWGLVRLRIHKGRHWLYAVDIILVYFLEYQSKYLVNYFFHILYVSTIVEAGVMLDRRRGNIVSLAVSLTAISKFLLAMRFGISASLISQLLFNVFALAFLVTLINFGKLQQEERNRSQALYRELVEAYHKLEELSKEKEKAAVLEERNRIARDMHDTLGHRLTSLIMQIEMAKRCSGAEPDKAEELLERCAQGARDALAGTRHALKALKGSEHYGIGGILSMVDRFRRDTGIDVVTDISQTDLAPEENEALFRVIQESITNAARHGNASRITIEVKRDGDTITFSIKDNGKGGEYGEGFGIINMRRRIEELGGTLRTSSGNGFTVSGQFHTRRR
ncbi:MAG: hypothetical protein HPY66_0594 [Firmicutes bacterium]|nr:hypothetical protein [Bacillota bacterium]MDI6707098.1 sensor histidine kinase [Bacillota bacterium]